MKETTRIDFGFDFLYTITPTLIELKGRHKRMKTITLHSLFIIIIIKQFVLNFSYRVYLHVFTSFKAKKKPKH